MNNEKKFSYKLQLFNYSVTQLFSYSVTQFLNYLCAQKKSHESYILNSIAFSENNTKSARKSIAIW